MTDDRTVEGRTPSAREADWERSERKSSWIALTIALLPIPASVLISWALGSPPWRDRAPTAHGTIEGVPADPERAARSKAHGHR